MSAALRLVPITEEHGSTATYAPAIKRAREGRGWSRARLARELGMAAVTVEHMERIGYAPGIRVAAAIADMLGVRYVRPEPEIDADTAYEDDAKCQYVVDHHPDGLALQQIGVLLGVSRERVRQIEFAALRKLRRSTDPDVHAVLKSWREALALLDDERDKRDVTVYVSGTHPSAEPYLTGGSSTSPQRRR